MIDLYKIKNLIPSIKDIHWKIEDSTFSDAVFFQVKKNIEKDFFQKFQYKYLFFDKDFPLRPINSFVLEGHDFFEAQKILLDHFYPLDSTQLVGITGTNGKTTTAFLCVQIAEQLGHSAFSIGTLGVRTSSQSLIENDFTTPPFIELRKYLSRFKYDVCFLEVSSHGLIQNRLYKILFDQAAWLSFSQDHLDYHQTLGEYFEAKCLIFSHLKKEEAIILPTRQYKLIKKLEKKFCISQAQTLEQRGFHSERSIFRAGFNKDNLEVALEINEKLWGSVATVSVDTLKMAPGRYSIEESKGRISVVDYSHTPDALENICQELKSSFPHKNLFVVFGCGGDRDKTKRPLMGAIAERYGDKIFVTSDNPRTEKPEKIIQDILVGMKGQAHVEVERKKAIHQALSQQKLNDIVLIAGKGHEDYQILGTKKIPFDDQKVVREYYDSRQSSH